MTKSKIPPKAGKLIILTILLLAVLQTVWFAVGAPVFAQSVDTAWVSRYNGPGDTTDYARAIAVDGSGNVYVTGWSYGTGTDLDYATIKYYTNGDIAWVRRYNGPGNSIDKAYSIAVDDYGNVYVTGLSTGSGVGLDYASIKYSPTGDTAWVRRYNGPGNSDDASYTIAVDSYGNVYVTGYSYGSGTDQDYATIKYYPNGDTAWVRRYNGPENSTDWAKPISVDGSGNVYVAGRSYSSETKDDNVTIKYYPNGDTAWVRKYNGPGNSTDGVYDMEVDGSGNIYVVGSSVGSGTTYDYATIKYYPNGDTAWVRRYNGPGNSIDNPYAIAVDDYGSVYVTGGSLGSVTGNDFATIKYYPNGDTAWVRRYNDPANSDDQAVAIAIDGSDNVYVTGWSYISGTSYDYATIRYYPDGDTAWIRTYNGSGNYWDGAYAIAIDVSGNVYVTGYSMGSGTDYDYATIKYVQFLCGDANKDGIINVGDIVFLVSYLYRGGPEPMPDVCIGDVNSDGVVNVGDIVYLVSYLYRGGPEPDPDCCG